MPAYLIANVTSYAAARRAARGLVEPTRLVVLEFPSMEQARRWYDSEDYRGPKALRMKCTVTDAIFVEGA